MRYLVQRDYQRVITIDDLNTVYDNGSDDTYTVLQRIIDTEPAAQEEIEGYLKQRYDVSRIFTDTPVFNNSVTYFGQNRVQYHEPAFDSTTVYTTNQRVSEGGSIYFSIGGSAAHAFNIAEWTFICNDYQLFYAIIPAQEYQYDVSYSLNNQVWFTDNYVYTSKIDNNIYPPTNPQYWTQGALYSFTSALPTDGTKWIQGDNRSALMVEKMVDIAIYKALKTITTRFRPEDRILNYMGDGKKPDGSALGWLTSLASGDRSANLPTLPPQQEELSLRWANSGGDSISNYVTPTPIMSY
jgi:hypothetical protein